MLCLYYEYSGDNLIFEILNEKLKIALSDHNDPTTFMEEIQCCVSGNKYADFHKFIQARSKDDKWKLWTNFVFRDGLAYVALYIAIRGGNWQLRMASIKCMAPIFTAFDRNLYSKLIPYHLASLQQFPKDLLNALETGAFTVSLTGKQWKSVAIDEAHEMCVNRDLKEAIVCPTEKYLQKTTLFFNYRIKSYKNVMKQIFLEHDEEHKVFIVDTSRQSVKEEGNIAKMIDLITTADFFPLDTTHN